MTTRSRTLLVSFLLISLISFGANYAVRPAVFEGYLWQAPLDPQTAEAVNLSVQFPSQKEDLEYSTQAEVLRFTLTADEEFTLRYLTILIESAGLDLPSKASDWKVYPVKNGRPDFSQEVGYGEQWKENYLRLRFSSSAALGYFGQEGENTFALVTSVFKTSESTEVPWLSTRFPRLLPEGMDWEFLPLKVVSPWMDVQEHFVISDVKSLPTESQMKS
jgi:hypothetical protein